MSVFSDQLVLWVINVLIHSTVLTAVLLCVAMLFRRRAAMRYWTLCCGLLLVLASPAVSALVQSRGSGWLALALPNENVPAAAVAVTEQPTPANDPFMQSLPTQQVVPSIMPPVLDTSSMEEVASTPIMSKPRVEADVPVNSPVSTPAVKDSRSFMQRLAIIVTFATIVWAVGAMLLLVRMTIGWIRLAGILRRAEPIADPGYVTAFTKACALAGCNEERTPRLVTSDEISGPLAAGIFAGSVVLPKRLMADSSPTELAEVFVHEVAHIVRRDPIVVLLQNLVAAIYWPHPLVRRLNHELAKAREEVCDNFVLATTKAPVYSRTLLSLAQLVQRPDTIPGSVGFFATRWRLEQRVAGLLDETRDTQTRLSTQGWAFVLASTVALLATICLSTITIATAQSPLQSPTENTKNLTADTDRSSAKEQEPSDEQAFRIVRGQVVNEDGEPVAGAKLWLPLQYEPRRVVRSTADDSGNFELRCPVDWISARVTGSSWTAWAYAPGYSIESQSVYEVVRRDSEKEYTIELPPKSDTTFRIMAPDNKPLAGVLVQPQNYQTSVGYDGVPEELQHVVSARTDANGIATLPAIQSDPLLRIEMRSTEFGRQSIRVDRNPELPVREIRLKPTASISGQLVGNDPKWVRGVKLSFTTDNDDEWNSSHGIAETITDDEGRFKVPTIASGGRLRTYVLLDTKLPVRPLLPSDQFLAKGETLQLEIPLVDAPRVYGKVLAKSTGNPVANAEISLGYGGYRQSDRVITDKNGQYEGRALPGPVWAHIIVLPGGFVQLGEPWAEPYQVPDNVSEFELPTIEVVGTREIVGRLIDAKDQPLPNMQVMAVKGNRRYGFGKSDKEGQFTMRVPEGVETTIEVYIEKGGQQPVFVVQKDPLVVRYTADVREKEMEAERALKRDVAMTGRVLSAGKPLKGVQVKLERGVPVFLGSGRSGTRYSQVSEAKTDATGSYRLVGLKAGDGYQIEINPPFLAADPTWLHQSPYFQSLSDDAEDEITLPDVNLLKLSQSITGVIVDPDGNPVEDATVTAQLRGGRSLSRMTESGPPPWTKSDRQGKFSLKELPDQPLTIMAYFANPKGGRIRFPAKIDVDLNQQDIRIVLDPSLQEDEE